MRMANENDSPLLVTVGGITFNKYSSIVISAILSKRKSLGGKSITETIEVIQQESILNKKIFSALISPLYPTEAVIRVYF